ncbi:hypothetical protein [Ferviditalea candida]|uniref:Uncharacterized protein n=1 Tax=Ferviditalea candida TaxID=3108399 RepID=A0ABU5ZJ66_9BACL|nr:hypothetical protein [Paenibacillaceae bacterium T2]
MYGNLFELAAYHARTLDPRAKDMLIVSIESLEDESWKLVNKALPLPFLLVTKYGYIPNATREEILRRKDPNLFLLGGGEQISEWVEYVLRTLTKGSVFRIVKSSRMI